MELSFLLTLVPNRYTVYLSKKDVNMTETSRREDYAGFVDYCAGIHRISVDRNMDLGWAYSTIRHILYDLKPIYSGYTSLKAIEKFNGLTTLMTREHYNGRANSSAWPSKFIGKNS